MTNSASKKLKLAYSINTKGILLYYGIVLFNIGLGAVKRVDYLLVSFPGFFSHTSNFIITSILVAVVSLMWLLQGAPVKLFVGLAFVAAVMNFLVELFIPFMNTPDIIDAVYGSAGALFTILVMIMIRKKGLVAIRDLIQPKA